MSLPVLQPSRVTVMIKPVGALCNLDCTYCYYLPTKTIYDGHEKRMSLRTLENVFASVLPRFGDQVTIAWQGGEPTLAGLPFFQKAIEYQEKYRRPNQQVSHALQTNGTLLDDDWCSFLAKHQFLIGLSMDGPPRFHDHYRISNRNQPTSDKVLAGMKLLQNTTSNTTSFA
ncbi:MAG: radical SAM protein [Phycisphaerales bacterium]|nr:radical SAM protein [Phycisphaerales bacterium]